MMSLCCDLVKALEGRTLSTAESCTGGGIGAAVTAVQGSSQIYKGGVVSYTDWVKENILGVNGDLLRREGAVSASVAKKMAFGVRKLMRTSVAVSVTGIAGPGTDAFGTPVGTVYIGYCDDRKNFSRGFSFEGDREQIRQCAVRAAIELLLNECK